jgi:cytochrome b561
VSGLSVSDSRKGAARPLAYSRSQIVLHWLVAGLVLVQYSTSGAIVRTHSIHLIGQRPNPSDLVLHTIHNRVGLTIIALMVARLALRLWVGAPLPGGSGPPRLTTRVAQGVHASFYAVLITEGVTGAVASYYWWPISAVHVILFDILVALITIHIAAALWHQFIRKDGVVGRVGIKQLFTGRNVG